MHTLVYYLRLSNILLVFLYQKDWLGVMLWGALMYYKLSGCEIELT